MGGAVPQRHGRTGRTAAPGVDPASAANRERLCAAAAALAAYRCHLLRAGHSPDSLRVGEIALTTGGGGLSAAAALQREYLTAVGDLVDTGAFCFERVKSHGA